MCTIVLVILLYKDHSCVEVVHGIANPV